MYTCFAQLYVVYSFMKAVHPIQAISCTQNAGWMKIQPALQETISGLWFYHIFATHNGNKFFNLDRCSPSPPQEGINESNYKEVANITERNGRKPHDSQTWTNKRTVGTCFFHSCSLDHSATLPSQDFREHLAQRMLLQSGGAWLQAGAMRYISLYVLRGRLLSWAKSAARPIHLSLYILLLSRIFEQSR